MNLKRDKMLEIYKLLDENQIELTIKKLTLLSENEIKELLFEVKMLERVIEGKIKSLKYDLLFDR